MNAFIQLLLSLYAVNPDHIFYEFHGIHFVLGFPATAVAFHTLQCWNLKVQIEANLNITRLKHVIQKAHFSIYCNCTMQSFTTQSNRNQSNPKQFTLWNILIMSEWGGFNAAMSLMFTEMKASKAIILVISPQSSQIGWIRYWYNFLSNFVVKMDHV